jgi:alpha-beta hydrolase superfamily lysophospholipase
METDDRREEEGRPMTVGGLGSIVARDGYTLRYRRYRPSGEPKGVVVAIHGIQSHAGWYDGSCRHLASSGLDVFFVDRRGSGINSEDRGHTTGVDELVDDLVRSVDHARRQVPGKPIFLKAISWGGKLAVAALKAHPSLVDGLILVCPGFFAKVGPTWRERLKIGGSYLIWPRRPVRVPLTEPALFTDNADWQEFLRQDKRLLRTGTARLLMTSVFLDHVVRRSAREIIVPTLTFLAGKDRIIDNDRVRRYVSAFAASDNQIIEYPSAHHTIEFEADPRAYFRDLSDWVLARAERPAQRTRLSG